MTKDQFWQTIDETNRRSLHMDQESRQALMTETLFHYTLEDIMDWHLILSAYHELADQNGLWAACTRLGASNSDDGFHYFRSWLISRGKEVYMNALRDPRTLDAVPFEGERLNFELFAYCAVYAYDAKLLRIDPDSSETLYQALGSYELDPQTAQDILAEVPRQDPSEQEWFERMFRMARGCECEMPEPQTIEGLCECSNIACGYVYEGESYEEYMFYNSPENIANFIGSHLRADKIIVTDDMDRLILNTMGHFIDECPDQRMLEQIKKVLIPIQLGQAEPAPFLCPTTDEVEVYLEEHGDPGMDMDL